MSENRLGPIPHPDVEAKEKVFSEEQERKYNQLIAEGDLMDDDQWRRFKANNREPVKVKNLDQFHKKLDLIAKTFFGPEKKSPAEIIEMMKKKEI